ncbi:MAG: hypothetical protein DME02_03455 [Candidatus Rokuibacteriota bacterium]|nr:MAG: hypothetical protein DME02_03455 [Candidatus Rokubacteria bacterium]
MRTLICTLALVVVLASAAQAGEPVAQTFNAPVERVWTVTEAVLKQLGWDIDKKDRTIGMIGTESQRVDGDNYVVYAKGRRHRLTLYVKAASDNRTTVTVERDVFKRERILWMDKDEPIATASDKQVERGILSAIGKAL